MSVITYLSKAPDLILPVTRKTTSTKHLSSVKHKKKTHRVWNKRKDWLNTSLAGKDPPYPLKFHH